METKPKTLVIVLVGISGSGKSTLLTFMLNSLLSCDLLQAPISATTRARRSYETNGKEYHFKSDQEFENDVLAGKFLEHERVHATGHRYGVLKEELERILAKGFSPIVDVNIAGALSLKKIYGEQAMLIWVDGPSDEGAVRHRLRTRGESEREIDIRLLTAREELQMRSQFTLFVGNSSEDRRVAQLELTKLVVGALRPKRIEGHDFAI